MRLDNNKRYNPYTSSYSIKPHEFRHSITIQRKATGLKDEDGLPVEELWEDYFTTRAKVLNTPGKEVLELRSIESEIDKTFYIRARHGKEVKEEDRIIYKNEVYNIAVPPNDIPDGGLYVEIKATLNK